MTATLEASFGATLRPLSRKASGRWREDPIDPEYPMVLELRAGHDPVHTYGFIGVVNGVRDLSASVWMWFHESEGTWAIRKIIDVPAESADPSVLPPLPQGFGSEPHLMPDISLSLDDRFLYVSCWGTGELRQYDVSDPFNPILAGSARLEGIAPQPSTVPVEEGPPVAFVAPAFGTPAEGRP
jgi:selenium-binding protein 1